jgi:hypothetical protein
MNTDKLLEAIQILVREEVKKQLPKIVSEVLQSQRKNKIVETIKSKKSARVVSTPSMAKAILGEESQNPRQKPQTSIQYTKNPMINQILNETRNTSAYPGTTDGFEEWPTMNNPIANMNPTSNMESIRASMAEKMGYGDMVGKSGLGVKTGNEVLDKAFNRDYSELVRRFDKK